MNKRIKNKRIKLRFKTALKRFLKYKKNPHFFNRPNVKTLKVGRYMGYKYVVQQMRNPQNKGGLNGYVAIAPGQPGYGFSHDYTEGDFILCHGGITWDGHDHNDRVIGFDTNHAGDYSYTNALMAKEMYGKLDAGLYARTLGHLHKWTVKEIVVQCESIITQLRSGDF